MESNPLIIERTFNASIDLVWKAITDKDEMKKWYFDLPTFKPQVGLKFQFEGGADPNNPYVHLCEVVEVIPGKKISYTWKYQAYPGESLLSFELFEEGNKTKLRLTHEGLESFPPIPDFAKENFVMGWNQIIGTSLKNYLEGIPK